MGNVQKNWILGLDDEITNIISEFVGENVLLIWSSKETEGIASLKQKLDENTRIKHNVSFLDRKRRKIYSKSQMKRKKTSFSIPNFLSKDECLAFGKLANANGFKDLGDLFPEDYRDHERSILFSQSLADSLYKRVANYFSSNDIKGKIPIGFGNAGIWRPAQCNECLKFNKYSKGAYFSWHQDGPWTPSEDYASVYTLIIYLNDVRQGGETLLSENYSMRCMYPKDDRWTKLNDVPKKKSVYNSILGRNKHPKKFPHFLNNYNQTVPAKDHGIEVQTPKAGKALLFEHSMWHTGVKVQHGTKYILKTEVIFRRTDREFHPASLRYMHDPEYRKARELYDESRKHEKNQNRQNFVDIYKQVLAKQIDASESSYVIEENILCDTDIRNVLEFLTPKEVMKCMMLSRQWYIASRNSTYWKTWYLHRWAKSGSYLESEINRRAEILSVDASVHDWFNYYQSRSRVSDNGPGIECMLAMPRYPHVYLKRSSGPMDTYDQLPTNTEEEVRGYHMRIRDKYRVNPSEYGTLHQTVDEDSAVRDWPNFLRWIVSFYFQERECSYYAYSYSSEEQTYVRDFGSSHFPMVFIEPWRGWTEEDRTKGRAACFEFLRSHAVHFLNEIECFCVNENACNAIIVALKAVKFAGISDDWVSGCVIVIEDFKIVHKKRFFDYRYGKIVLKDSNSLQLLQFFKKMVDDTIQKDQSHYEHIILPLVGEKGYERNFSEQLKKKLGGKIIIEGFENWRWFRLGSDYLAGTIEVDFRRRVLAGASLLTLAPGFREELSFIL